MLASERQCLISTSLSDQPLLCKDIVEQKTLYKQVEQEK